MSYFDTAAEASAALGLELLLRADPDPRSLQRPDRLSRYAASTAESARLRHRLESRLAALPPWPRAERILWVAGPWGSLEHLPWAVGLADQMSRAHGLAYLAERGTEGPLHALAAGGRHRRTDDAGARSLFPDGAEAATTDLEGVRILLPALAASGPLPAETRTDPGGDVLRASPRDCWIILTDSLPEWLEGPYPSAENLAGIVLAASFRDHTRYELETIVRQLRAAGHRLFGWVAIGVETLIQPPEPKREDSLSFPKEVPAGAPDQLSAASLADLSTAPAPTANTSSISIGAPLPGAPEAPMATAGASAAAPPAPGASSPLAPTAGASIAGASTTPAPEEAAELSPAGEDADHGMPSGGTAATSESATGSVPLLATWDREVLGRARRRRGHASLLLVLLLIAVVIGIFQIMVRPLLPKQNRRAAESPAGLSASPRDSVTENAPSLRAALSESLRSGARDSLRRADSLRTGMALPRPDSEPVTAGGGRAALELMEVGARSDR